MSSKLPPSKLEQDALKVARNRDLPRPAPRPAPPTLGAGQGERAVQVQRNAHAREQRIKQIGALLAKNRGNARRDFNRGPS